MKFNSLLLLSPLFLFAQENDQECSPVQAAHLQPSISWPFAFETRIGLGFEAAHLSFLSYYKDYSDVVDFIYEFAGPRITLSQEATLSKWAFLSLNGAACTGGSEISVSAYQTDALRLRTLHWTLDTRFGANFGSEKVHFRPFGLFAWDRIITNGVATNPTAKPYAFYRLSYYRIGLGLETTYKTPATGFAFGVAYSFPWAKFQASDPGSINYNLTISELQTKVSSGRVGLNAYAKGRFAVTDWIDMQGGLEYTNLFARGRYLPGFNFGSYRSTYARFASVTGTMSVVLSY